MAKIFVTGHRNPDMDSICSAWAYAKLKNTVDGINEYVPVRLGNVSDNVKYLFSRAGAEIPSLLKDVKARSRDIVKSPTFTVTGKDPVYELISLLNTYHPSVVPVIDDGEYKALVSVDDINRFFLMENHKGRPFYTISQKNIPRIIEGHFLRRGPEDTFDAQIVVGAMDYEVFCDRVSSCEKPPLLVVGNRKRHIAYAIEHKLAGIILTGITDIESVECDFSTYEGMVYLSEEDTAETLRLLRLSTPINQVIAVKDAPRVEMDSLYDEVKAILTDGENRGVSVFEDGKWKGFITRRCFLNRPRAKIIMMDHNEAEQSVIGIEEADIVEIVDHHRLAAPKMNNPIFICSEPVGSTCTIVYEQYVKWQVPLDALTATILLGGLVADTVMLKSPTTTDYDRFVAQELGKSAKIDDFDEFCHSLFSSSSSLKDKDPMSFISSDFKKYREHGVHFGIGQVEVGSLEEIKELKDTYLEKLREFRDREALSIAMLLVTDVFKEESVLLTTNFDKEYKIPYEKMGKGMYYLPGVLSRKKQLLPETLKVLED